MKIAITGKGGVGKSTISAALCKSFAERGYRVLAVDVDPDENLALALGMDAKTASTITQFQKQKIWWKKEQEQNRGHLAVLLN